MTCPKREADIALYAGGDLPAGRIARIESHLGGCPDCRALLEELRAGHALLGELRHEPLDEAMVAQVHRQVLARVGTAEPGLARRYWKLALAAALVLAAVLALPWRTAKHEPVARVVEPPPRIQPAPAPPPAVVPVRHPVVRRRRRAKPPRAAAPLLVQFVTDDPNIVIYWLVDRKPEGD
jgi:anti-sigma factor RsiW